MSIPEVTLTIQSVRSNSPDEVGRAFRMKRVPVVIGRALDCEIQLKDLSVSRLHLRVDLERDRLAITNLSRRSISVIDGCNLEAGQRFETRYRDLPIIVGSVECAITVSYETEEPAWLPFATELTAEHLPHNKQTLDIPGLTSPPNDYTHGGRIVNDPIVAALKTPTPSAPIFFHVVEGRAAAAVSVGGNWLEVPRMTALALSALAKSPGVPVAEETIERVSGSESMITKHVSIARTAVRTLIETQKIQREDIYRQILSFPGFERAELEALSLEALMRKFILSRRGFGYILHVRPDEVEHSSS